jgi:hypothetical protein
MSIDLVGVVAARLKAQVTALQNRVDDAAELAVLIQQKRLPQRVPAAFVLPIGEDAEPAGDHTGLSVQRITDVVAIVLMERKQGDASGAEALAKTVPLRDQVRDAIAGWSPNASPYYEPMQFRRGRMVTMNEGAVFYQLDFSTRWHHRVPNS